MYNVKDERKKQNVAGIRRLHESARPSSLSAALGTPDSNEEIQQGESEQTKARTLYTPFPTTCFWSAGFLSNSDEKSSQLAGRNTRE